MRRTSLIAALAASLAVPSFAGADPGNGNGNGNKPEQPVFTGARAASPVVLTGAQLPDWSRLSAQGLGKPYPSGAMTTGDAVRHAHNGQLTVPPDVRTGVPVDEIAAYRWNGKKLVEVPVQVDQRFPYFLANGRSDFSTYSGTDEELTYAWAPDAHATGEEAWKKAFGDCFARYATPEENAALPAHVNPAPAGSLDTLGYTGAMQDPVATLDDDDEIVVMARDAGPAAPAGTPAPKNAIGGGQAVKVADPLAPGTTAYVYLFRTATGSSFTAATSPYVQLTRDANADEWIDRHSFAPDDPEKLGTSNTGYGPNLPGTVCRTDPRNDGRITALDGESRASTDRFPRDGMTVTTPTYQTTATGRWMVRDFRVTRPGAEYDFGPDLVSRWKGRAFQQSPDSTISVVGFEDEQVNWEANSVLLGWRAGPVRAIRETWGADSGTNVTKTELYYRDADVYNYHVRVHPIPPDGLYTSWNYNPGAVSTYYTLARPAGVPVDGVNDDGFQIDEDPVRGEPAFFDTCDPTLDVCSPLNRPEQVAGPNGGLVYQFELTTPPTGLAGNFSAVPYYRDDACLDDGTGDTPVPRPWPGEASTDSRVKQGYVDYWKANGAPADLTYADLKCDPAADPATTPAWQRTPFAGAFGQHGLHFFVTQDSDNAFLPKPTTELNGQQWRFAVPMDTARNVLLDYSPNVSAKLTPVVTPFGLPAL
ncbi:MAG TPA: hypothetical protein VNA20_07515 [Frankiaceae bacterium]|nr:hypothetical protein [Frankiaceae bacterium]